MAHAYPALFFGFHGAQFKWQIKEEPDRTLLARAVRKFGPVRRAARRLGLSFEYEASCYADPKYRAELDRWIHIAATYDGSTARLYADGIEICSRPNSGAIRVADSPFTISGYFDESGEIVDEITGKLDDVRIYNRALTEANIRDVYSKGMAFGSRGQD